MAKRDPQFTPQTARVLDALLQNPGLSGAEVTKLTGILSGTLYPILIRLEEAGWLESRWEENAPSDLGRPRRRLYKVTGLGATQARARASELNDLWGRLAWT